MGKIMPAIMDLYSDFESVEILEMDAFTLREPQTTIRKTTFRLFLREGDDNSPSP